MSELVNRNETDLLTRRAFVKASGAAVTTALLAAVGQSLPAHSLPAGVQTLPTHPNILLLVTDQERYPRHWPDGWADENLPNHRRLAEHGLTFRRAFCNAAMCSPSRATLFTGLYPPQHGVTRTLTYDGSASASETPLPNDFRQTMGHMLRAAGYRVVLKGKWHVSKSLSGGAPSAEDLSQLGFDEWEPTTICENQEVTNFAGGCADWDRRVADQAIDFLAAQTEASAPFALIVGLGNPHDVLSYPRTYDTVDPETGCNNYADTTFGREIELPVTSGEDLSTKPTCQTESLDLYAFGLGVLATPQARADYVNFYAQLVAQVDVQIGRILDALTPAMIANTVVILTSDHGELGLAHGGQRQKMFSIYEETVNVPLIMSNPTLFPAAQTTDAYASLVDLMPTLASLASVPNREGYLFSGVDLTPLFTDTAQSIRNEVFFTFDDDNVGQAEGMPQRPNGNPYVRQPNHIRCIICRDDDGEWKYARYFDPSQQAPDQIEMYQLRDGQGADIDPTEENNLAADGETASKRTELAQRLAALEARYGGRASWLFAPLIQAS